MCALVYSSLLLYTLTTSSVFLGTMMVTEGLPLNRQERGTDSGILAGADFLSVFMSSSLRQAYVETTTTTPEPTTIPATTWYTEPSEPEDASYTRETRSPSFFTLPPVLQPKTGDHTSYYSANKEEILDVVKEQSSDSSLKDDGVVISTSVSSSVGRTLINKAKASQENIEDTTVRENGSQPPDQTLVASEEHSSIVAEANKSEFSVEESEPITTNRDLVTDFSRGYPASVQSLPRSLQNSQFRSNPEFVAQPIQQTVIFHNNPREPGRARSVSYSTVIQAVPHDEKRWNGGKHYEPAQTAYSQNNLAKVSFNNTDHKNDLISTDQGRSETNWEKSEEAYAPGSRKGKVEFTTERNWGIPEKPYPPHRQLPTVYGQPEQNYEVDESASVMTNGRIHGIQPNPTVASKQDVKNDDNKKKTVIVEGPNYRKYMVEERTADGFIVGEYGFVSHDDGSLRGVRYTADGTISPQLIHDTLKKFLAL